MEDTDQSHTDSRNSNTVDTHTETTEAKCLLEEEGEMQIDEHSVKESMKRKVSSDEVFPDLQLFIDSVKAFKKNPGVLGEKAFTDQEIYRLKKLLKKVKKQLDDDE